MNTYSYYTEKKKIKYFAGIRCDDTENVYSEINARDIKQAREKLRNVDYWELKLSRRGKTKKATKKATTETPGIIRKTFSVNKFKGVLRVSSDGNLHGYLYYFRPNGKAIDEYADAKPEIEALIKKADAYCKDHGLTLWCY